MNIRRVIRNTLLTLGALALVAAGAIAWHTWPRTREFYSDADAIKRPVEQATAREILWKPPSPLPGWATAMADEYEPRLSDDGLTLYFVRGKVGGGEKAGADIYTSRRTSSGWTEPRSLTDINSSADDLGPEISADGKLLYFYSDRPGGQGGYDLWMSRMVEGKWQAPVNLGTRVNSPYNDYGVAVAPDGLTLYFSSNRPRPQDSHSPTKDAWTATLREDLYRHDYDLYEAKLIDGEPAEAQFLAALNSPSHEGAPAISPAGDFLYFCSDREGGLGGFDIYRARRINGVFERASNLGDSINTSASEMDPALAMGGYALYFSSNRKSAGGDASDDRYRLYWSSSREVFKQVERQQAQIDWAALWALIGPNLLWGLLALLLFLLALALMNDLRRRQLSLLARCLIVSLMIHLLLMLLFNAWQVTASIAGLLDKPGGIKIALTSAARADDLAAQIRGNLTEIEVPAVKLPEPQRAAPEAISAPSPESVALPAEQIETQIASTPSASIEVPERTAEFSNEPMPVKASELAPAVEPAIELPQTLEKVASREAASATPQTASAIAQLPAPVLKIVTTRPSGESSVRLSPDPVDLAAAASTQSLAQLPAPSNELPAMEVVPGSVSEIAMFEQPALETALPLPPTGSRENLPESEPSRAIFSAEAAGGLEAPTLSMPAPASTSATLAPATIPDSPGQATSIAELPSSDMATGDRLPVDASTTLGGTSPVSAMPDQAADALDLALPSVESPQIVPTDAVANSPTGPVIGTLRGRVTSATTDMPLARSAVRVNVLGEEAEAMVAITDGNGVYSLQLPVVPNMFAVSASKRGYLPSSENVETERLEGGELELNFQLTPATRRIIAIEDQPDVHHLGNDRFEGSINSQFQKESEGLSFTAEFTLTPDQCAPAMSRAAVLMLAKGVQCPHKIRINGKALRRRLRPTPEDGSFGRFTATFSADLLRPGVNTIEIIDVYCNDDLDDFEFVNIQIRLSP